MDLEFETDVQTYQDEELAVRMSEVAAAERQQQVQMMLTKQLDKGGSLEQQIKQQKSFTKGAIVKSIPDHTTGELSLKDFVSLQQEHKALDELRDCGLTDNEIAFKLHQEGKRSTIIQPIKRGNLSVDPVVQSKRLKAVNSQVTQQQDNQASTSGSCLETHTEDDSNVSLQANQTRRKGIFSHLSLSKRFVHPDDPINHLHLIEDKLFNKTSGDDDSSPLVYQGCDPKPESYSKKEGALDGGQDNDVSSESALEDDISYVHKPWVPVPLPEGIQELYNRLSANNVKDKASCESGCRSEPSRHSTSSHRQTACPHSKTSTSQSSLLRCEAEQATNVRQTIETGCVRPRLLGQVSSVSLEDIRSNRLTEDEIRKLDRFKNYTPGSPSKVLYLKNLPKQVTEEDLGSLFSRFQETGKPKIVYKLLSGRMRGQAFVTFNNIDTATSAMKLINGYKLKGRPLIVQYGRQSPK